MKKLLPILAVKRYKDIFAVTTLLGALGALVYIAPLVVGFVAAVCILTWAIVHCVNRWAE